MKIAAAMVGTAQRHGASRLPYFRFRSVDWTRQQTFGIERRRNPFLFSQTVLRH
jgi:hypothetical protein